MDGQMVMKVVSIVCSRSNDKESLSKNLRHQVSNYSTPCGDIQRKLDKLPGHRMGDCSPLAQMTKRCACGMWRQDGKYVLLKATQMTSLVYPSLLIVVFWPRNPVMERC